MHSPGYSGTFVTFGEMALERLFGSFAFRGFLARGGLEVIEDLIEFGMGFAGVLNHFTAIYVPAGLFSQGPARFCCPAG